ncbi:flagellar hook protein FlgK [Herbaspirillum rubrisubalbicans]|uniref:Flagellar hook-associated protein 1 n=5 Tax=Herbaspirillum TaxID=963 RepID=A0ABX9C610_9BURK|nr:flagellar hook-associated protein FlgK [Herbaspirillum rubrisubalbicans]QJQ00735.1 flagellar hook-associated protein FlgK [Herbaspirillum rubrisubalbicans Os34]RAM66030.1 flagellar hook protein FlgK [Herbaspirillum rubrisubalbicans]RAN50519.1 flagellar hook protein FlgK [Herbaspirillum rubrisubalbicans]
MATNIFSIGQSALQAAMAAQATTSHNISNATTPGYNRQEVVQSSAGGINYGYGFVGQGTQVTEIKRVYNDFLTKQALASQTSASSLDSYYAQISQINNMVADTKAGLSPALQDFFASVQNLASNPNTQASRQTVLSQASTLVARISSINDQLSQSSASVNSQITSTVTTINSYAQQIAQLNQAIVNAVGTGGGQQPNDLLDQRDQLVSELNKYVKITTVPQDTGAVSVFIGTGQSLVTGDQVTQLAVTNSPTDVSRLQVGQVLPGGGTATIPDSFFYDGGSLGGLLRYRTETLDPTQNALGRIAIAMGTAFNQQQQLGLDQNGNPGTNMFNISSPNLIGYPTNTGTTDLKAVITDPSSLSTSDYTLTYDGTNYTFTRLSDNTKTVKAATDFPVTLDGVTYSNGAAAPGPFAPSIPSGNIYKIQPTANGAAAFSLALNNTQLLASAAPISTAANATNNVNASMPATNTGNAIISNTALDSTKFQQGSSVSFTASVSGSQVQLSAAWTGAAPVPTVTYTNPDGSTGTASGGAAFNYTPGMTISSGGVSFTLTGTPGTTAPDKFNFAPVAANKGTATISAGSVTPAYLTTTTPLTKPTTLTFNNTASPPVFNISPAVPAGGGTITHKDGTTTAIAGGASTLSYTAGDTYEISGVKFQISSQPANGDQFTIAANTNATSDNRNMLAMANLQTANTINGTSFQGSYSQLVATIGNKTNEINVTNTAEKTRLTAIQNQQQSDSGVNQDEELAHMIRNQQQYQAAAKIIQAASDMINALLSLGS